ncbi:MAG: BamA/TamA family outer membrane protein [Balneolaceae bacterium]|nr:BamA/TamA family outer membrane protein [Balneolaceae bacterium]
MIRFPIKLNHIIKAKYFFISSLLFFVLPSSSLFANDNGEREPIVWKISFEGNEEYRSMVLHQVIATSRPPVLRKVFGRHSEFVLNETELRRDVVRLERYYQRRGYPNVQVRYEIEDRRREWRKNVTFYIQEGSSMRISSSVIEIDADDQTKREIREAREFIRTAERHDYREGRRYQLIRQPDVEGAFREMLENLGYAWPEVSIEAEEDSLSNRADIRIKLKPNSKTFFTDFEIEGDLTVPERVLIRQTDIKPGDVYSRRQIQASQRSIFNHHLFRFATITLPEQEKDSTLTALIRVREYPLRTVEASIGFGREEIVRGQAAWRHRNINGTGHRFGVNARASFIEQRVGTNYLIPYIFNSRSSNVTSIFGLHRLEPAYELFQAGFNSGLIYQPRRNQTASLSYEFSINEELSRDQGVQLPDSILNYTISSFTISGYYSEGLSRDQRGWVVQPSAEFSGTFGEASFTFQKFNLDVRRFTPVTNSLTFAKRVNGGVIFYNQDESLPANVRYYSGGTNSVRGWTRQSLGPSLPAFREDGSFSEYIPIGGRATFSFNMELRQQLTQIIPNFGIAAFLDGGQVWSGIRAIDERPVQFGAGGGIRYQSPIGPVRVDFAYKINPSDEDLNIYAGQDFGSGWDRIGIHFSIGQAF